MRNDQKLRPGENHAPDRLFSGKDRGLPILARPLSIRLPFFSAGFFKSCPNNLHWSGLLLLKKAFAGTDIATIADYLTTNRMRIYMKHLLLFIFPFLTMGKAAVAQSPGDWQTKVAPEVRAALERGQPTSYLVVFQEQADLSAARQLPTKLEKARYVYRTLVETATRVQINASRLLTAAQAPANSFYLVNAIAVESADLALARRLAALPEVRSISLDPEIPVHGPADPTPAPVSNRNTIEWGVQRINAPAVWALGYNGQGITVGGADTGYDWLHPALQPHYRGYNAATGAANHDYNWHDAIHEISPLSGDTTNNPANNPCGVNSPVPCDDNSHGTHTMGTMTGDDGQGNQIGVAPGAKWIACRNMERGNGKPSSYIECFQWFIAPTDLSGQNPEPDRAPEVINNSWYCSTTEGCTSLAINELMRQAIINLRNSGVVVVVSNGNFGPSCASTYGPPAYFEESFSVGATRADDFIASFSSRGPVTVDSSFRIKPNVSAPGQDIRSSVLNGGYSSFSGTSMAGPHVAGLVALLLSARPDLAGQVELIETIIEQTAVPFADTSHCSVPGNARPNLAFGWGRVDALAAVNAALAVPTSQPSTAALTVRVAPNPMRDNAVFEVQNGFGKTTLEIFNTGGQLVFSKNWTVQNRELVLVGLMDQPAGLYFWRLRTGTGLISGKLLKQ